MGDVHLNIVNCFISSKYAIFLLTYVQKNDNMLFEGVTRLHEYCSGLQLI